MKRATSTLGIAVLTAAVTFALPAMAADNAATGNEQSQGNVSYVSGGVGDDEAAALKSAAAGYPLELQFVQKSAPRDEFVADVKVRITDRSRNVVLDAVSNGPYFLAKLPSGRYDVEADYDGVVKKRSVDVRSGKHQRAVFVWGPTDDTRQSMADDNPSSAATRTR